MRLKRCALSLLLATLGLTALFAVSCGTDLQQPARDTNSLPGVVEAELWSDHKHLEFGEPIRVRATLKNVSREVQVLGNETVPVIDIRMRSYAEVREWSQEHPNEVKHQVTLKPGASYVIEWIVTPTLRTTYTFIAWWAEPRGLRPQMAISIDCGVLPPGPMP
jgi:hypothetical protein